MNDHIKITNESPAPKCNWPTGACWHIHPEAEERAMLEHKQINDDAAARLIAAIPNYQGTQVNQTIHPMSDEEQESRLYLSSYDALSPHEQTLAHHQRDWKLAVDQAALAPQTGEVTLSSQVILDVDRRLRATPSPAADRERAITGEPPEVTLLHEEIESWRKLVEDYKREMKLWASGKVFRDLYPNSPLLGAITGEPVASQKYLEHEKTRSIAHGVMNALAGDIDKAFGSIIGSRIPDSIHVYLVELTHAAVDMSFAALRSDPPDRELLWQAFEYLEGYAIFEEERGHSSTAEGCRASAGAISRLLRAAPITGETSRDVAAEGESDAEHRILDAVSAYVDACEENGSNPGPDSDAATEASWASLTSIVRAACEGAGSIPSEEYLQGMNDALEGVAAQVEFWVTNRYHAMPSIQKQIDRENETIEIGVTSAIESVRRRLPGHRRAALAVPNEGAEFEPGTCARCGKDYSMHDPQMEPTKYCNDCAHVIAESVPVGPSEGSPVSNQFIEKLNELSPSEGIASVAASDGSNQLLGLLAIQAEDIRKVLDELAPETVGNLQTRLRAALVAASDESLSRQSSEAAESHRSTRNTRRWADCAHCGGTGEVDDGELTHHEGTNIPFACGPIKCTKDCPKCGGHPW